MVLNRWSRNTWRWSESEHETGELQMYNFRVQIIRILKPQESQHIVSLIPTMRKAFSMSAVRPILCQQKLTSVSNKSIVQRVSTFSVLGWIIVHIPQFGCFAVSSYHGVVWKVAYVFLLIVLLCSKSFQDSRAQLLFKNLLYNTKHCIQFTVYFYSFHTYVTSFTRFTLHLLCIYKAHAEYFLIPDDAVDRRKLGFRILHFLNNSLRPH